jgi:hypothetical protein
MDGEAKIELQRNDSFAVSEALGKYGSSEEAPSRSSKKQEGGETIGE